MRRLFPGWLWLAAVAAGAAPLPESVPSNAPPRIQLRDQYDRQQSLSFPTTNLTFVVIADKAGSEQIAGWVAPVKQRFGTAVDIRGIADVSAVPAPLRGMVRRGFRKSNPYPVMLDWSGETVRAFVCAPQRANVFLLNQQGGILRRLSGPASERGLRDLCGSIERLLPDAGRAGVGGASGVSP
jgi:hypothetical protein